MPSWHTVLTTVVLFGVYPQQCHAAVAALWQYGPNWDLTYKPGKSVAEMVQLPRNIPFMQMRVAAIEVNAHGEIAFHEAGGGEARYRLVLWGHAMDLTANTAGIVYYRHMSAPRDFIRATEDILASFKDTYKPFKVTHGLVLTFHKVTYKLGDNSTPTNTAQMVLATNGTFSFMSLNYGEIEWTRNIDGVPALTGILSKSHTVCFHPGYASISTSHHMELTNGCQPGRVIWRVDSLFCESPQESCMPTSGSDGGKERQRSLTSTEVDSDLTTEVNQATTDDYLRTSVTAVTTVTGNSIGTHYEEVARESGTASRGTPFCTGLTAVTVIAIILPLW